MLCHAQIGIFSTPLGKILLYLTWSALIKKSLLSYKLLIDKKFRNLRCKKTGLADDNFQTVSKPCEKLIASGEIVVRLFGITHRNAKYVQKAQFSHGYCYLWSKENQRS